MFNIIKVELQLLSRQCKLLLVLLNKSQLRANLCRYCVRVYVLKLFLLPCWSKVR